MKFTTKPSVPKAMALDTLDILEAQENMRQAWRDLDESAKQLDEVQDVMDNINLATHSIEQFGMDAVPILNIDHGLESLLGVPEKLITADKALEGLGEAAKRAWEKLKEWIMKFVEFIKKLHKRWKDRVQLKINSSILRDAIAAARKNSGTNFDSEFQSTYCRSYPSGCEPTPTELALYWDSCVEEANDALDACRSLPKSGDVARLDKCIEAVVRSTDVLKHRAMGGDYKNTINQETFRDAGFSKPEDALAWLDKQLKYVFSGLNAIEDCNDKMKAFIGPYNSSTGNQSDAEKRRDDVRLGLATICRVTDRMLEVNQVLFRRVDAVGNRLQRFVYNHLSSADKEKFAGIKVTNES